MDPDFRSRRRSCLNWEPCRLDIVSLSHTHTHTHTHNFLHHILLVIWQFLKFLDVNICFPLSLSSVQFSSVAQSCLTLCARQASLSITNSQSLPKLMSIESVMPSNYLILCHPLLLLPSIFPNIRVFSNESALRINWPKYWHFSFSISLSNLVVAVLLY